MRDRLLFFLSSGFFSTQRKTFSAFFVKNSILKNCMMAMVLMVLLGGITGLSGCAPEDPQEEKQESKHEKDAFEATQEAVISLPEPDIAGEMKLEEALSQRVSRRDFTDEDLSLEQIAQLAWSAQGVSTPGDGTSGATRTAPSAGGTHPLAIYLVTGEMSALNAGVYRYDAENHELTAVINEDRREALASAALDQDFISDAPANVVVAAHYEETTLHYGDRGGRYVKMEAGHASQNISLQVEALDMNSVVIGAFEDDNVMQVLETDASPLAIIPVGYSN